MTSDRPYHRGQPESEALEELRRHAGTQFDGQCVGALTRVLRRHPQWLATPLADGRTFGAFETSA